ncbi:iron(III) transport system ATP-binding protein [Moraxella cuniculi DSM 21768]|uniref:Iron(III) transport system ATP-binding protein n=1 Tax=Moraxella cuniculi DSM 21768 TaxID=1122245 RepID=A0A1N7E1U2_9GAMM|nr:ABC transporter ATP-binding protein [Moraxella cuniculi]OOS04620.1 Fe3+/spermidine/putrescine ABC transporter ATP-binding protein [Moraxella cuniculi]SIR82092.1 iron(III) transport system ATP-binding protein [Moraxella cuniculi DSM 21768]
MLRIDNLSISFDNKPILNNVSLQLQTGEIACLLGRSGCGKTTLLRCIAGFEKPDSGSISIRGATLFDKNTHTPAHKRQIGMVFQDYALFPHLTVADNIAFGLKLDKTATNHRIDEMLELVNMREYRHSYPHELSGGQQQRVALVRALACSPSLILLDEPFSNLDVELRASLSKEVRQLLKSQQVCAIMVTHDQAEAFAMADKVGVISQGVLQQWDTPDALYHTPANQAVAQFIGEGVLIDIHQLAALPLNEHLKAALNPAVNTVLVRPHDVSPANTDDNHTISGTILDKDFRGGYWLYTLGTQTGQTLLMQLSLAESQYALGDTLMVSINRFCTLS